MVRVAFTAIGGRNWTGGLNYLYNLLAVLSHYEPHRITPVLFLGHEEAGEEWERFTAIDRLEIVRDSAFAPDRTRSALARALLLGKDAAAEKQFIRHRIDVVFESARFYGWRLSLPAVAWFPDFQHRELPSLFSASARLRRELGFRAQVASGREVMLSSDDARQACLTFYPGVAGHAHAVPFAMQPGVAMPMEQARELTRALGVDEPFFFLPNQFWRHKNHALVVEALGLLRKRGRRVRIVASGQQSDPRAPGYFTSLQSRIEQLGLAEDILLPGLIPYEQVRALLRTCDALLNPSLFEGWSTTVEEARLLGVPMLLSDLPVHREQMGREAVYFDRHCPHSLADCLYAFRPLSDVERLAAFQCALAYGPARASAYAAAFTDLMERAAAVPTRRTVQRG